MIRIHVVTWVVVSHLVAVHRKKCLCKHILLYCCSSWDIHRLDIGLLIKDRINIAALRMVLLYGSKTRPMTPEDLRRFAVPEHRCLPSIRRI